MRGLLLAALLAAVLLVAARWGSFVAGGSDSYCYVHQAERWAAVLRHPLTARLQEVEPLALQAPWPEPALAFAPSGHVPSQTVAGASVPVCAAGLSLAMAPFLLLGGPAAAFAVVPLFGALLVLATYTIGARFGARVGMAAALLAACSPTFLYQLVQPMSDVPAAALWLLAVAAATGTKPRHAALAGMATSAAIVVRPNLVPLGGVIGLFLLLRPERTWQARLRAAATYAAWCAPGCVAVAAIQQQFYGSPLASGYGSLAALFRAEHVAANLDRYPRWLWQAHTPALGLAALAPFLLPGPLVALFAGLVAVNVALYLPYVVFADWGYTRFLLPTIPLLLVMVAAVVDAIWRRLRLRWPGAAVATVAVALAVLFVGAARDRSVFRLQQMEARFARAGSYVAARLPANALVITSAQSGSIRFYAGRRTLVWDQLDPAWLDRAIGWSRSRGFDPYLLLERAEEQGFRARFGASDLARLDWPPMAEIASQVRIYRPDDRQRYLQGDGAPTEYAP